MQRKHFLNVATALVPSSHSSTNALGRWFGRKLIPLLGTRLIILAIAPVFAAGSVFAQEKPPVFQVGFAERDISPDIGMEQPGGYGKSFHRVFHDACKVRAGVFGDGRERVAIISVDALAVRTPTVAKCREEIMKQTGIRPEAVLIHATHSHSSGPTCMVMPGEFDKASEEIRKLAYEQSSCADPVYLERVEKLLVEAVVEADKKREQSTATVGTGHAEGVAFNRRFRMRNGMTMTHPGAGNPDIIEPAGPVDTQVGVLGVWDAEQKLKGVLVNFSCHATMNPGGISANYIYYVEKVIRSVFGEQTIVVFLNGMSGDVTQVDNYAKENNPSSKEWGQVVGGSVGAEAVKILFRDPKGEITPINAVAKTLQIDRRRPSVANVKKAEDLVSRRKEVPAADWTFAKETVMLNHLCEIEPTVPVEVQAVQIGPVVLVTSPAEYFVEFGLRIKEASPFPVTFPVSLANGCVGYVPTTEAFGPRGGGYETRLSSYSNLRITAGDEICETGIELEKTFKPGAMPSRGVRPPFKGGPWPYGSVPPELE